LSDGKFFGNGEFDKVKEARSVLASVIWILVSTFGVAILLYNESFLNLWVGEGKYAGGTENLLLLFIGVQFIFFFMDGNFINVTLDMATKVIITALSSLVTIALAFLLVEKYHIMGMAFSILAGRLVLTIGYPIILKKKMNEGISFFNADNLRPLLVALLFFLLANYISGSIKIENWFVLIGIGSVTALVSALLFWFVGLSKRSRRDVFAVVSKVKFLGLKQTER